MKKYITGKLAFIEDSGYFGMITEQYNVKIFRELDSFDIMHNNNWIPISMHTSPEGWEFLCLDEDAMDQMPLMGVEVRYLPEEDDEDLPACLFD